jgi:predicted metal-dependent phosphoesterase TrpH
MAQALTELGFHVDHARLDAHTAQGNAIGRPHLARAVVEDAANQDRIADEELVDPTLFLQAYLLPGRPAYRGRTTPTVQEAIATIHRAGGLAVWAHPFWDIADQEDVLATAGAFQAWGLDGVEAFYATHDRSQTLALCDLCRRTGLLSTGSSDFHGPDHRLFHQFRAFSLYGREPNLGPIADAAHAQSSPHETSQTAH